MDLREERTRHDKLDPEAKLSLSEGIEILSRALLIVPGSLLCTCESNRKTDLQEKIEGAFLPN